MMMTMMMDMMMLMVMTLTMTMMMTSLTLVILLARDDELFIANMFHTFTPGIFSTSCRHVAPRPESIHLKPPCQLNSLP